MKKLVVSGFILSMALLAALVAANYDSSKDVVSVSLTKGWNIVPFFVINSYIPDANNPGQNIPVQRVLEPISMAVWFYDIEGKKYVPYIDWFKDKSIFTESDYGVYNNFNNKVNAYPALQEHLKISGFWLYLSEPVTLNMAGMQGTSDRFSDMGKNMTLYNGWNFVSVYPVMVGKTLAGLKGDCEIPRFAIWDNTRQGWSTGTWTGREFTPSSANDVIGDSLVGMTILMKVSNNGGCKLATGGRSESVAPPALP